MIRIQLILALFLSFSYGELLAQDWIIKKNGEEIEAKVIEIKFDEIVYKKQSNLNGPNYNINKTEVFMIKYENGEKEMFEQHKNEKFILKENSQLKIVSSSFSVKYYEGDQKIERSDFLKKLENNPNACNEYFLSKKLRTAGMIVGIPSGLVFGYCVGYYLGSALSGEAAQISIPVLAISGICWGGSLALAFIADSKFKKSIEIYNKSEKISLNFNIDGNGVGLALRF